MIGLIIGIVLGLISGRLTYGISEFFIAPREHWRKSRWDILLIKLGMAFTVGFYVAFLVAGLIGA